MRKKQKVLIIVGPTSSGKSALAVDVAERFNGEIISADSRQVYRGLDIGTGKITKREMRGVRHHLLDVISPKRIFTARDFVARARDCCSSILQNTRMPIVAGGTGFYIDVLLGRIELPDVPPNSKLRKRLEAKSAAQLFTLLKKKDPRRAKTIDRNNKRRLVRALEIAAAKRPGPVRLNLAGYDALWIGLSPSPDDLRARINTRLKDRLRAGMIAEARRLHSNGLSYKRMHELGLEYRSLARFLQGKISRSELETELQYAIWHYAKRQMTYWRRNKDIEWFQLQETSAVLKLVSKWLKDI